MKYTKTVLKEIINIESIRTVHYFEYSKDYVYEGEKHDFWEIVYVDKGNVTVGADDKKILLNQGDVYFHKPMQWHNVAADGVTAPNLAVISFDSKSEAMEYFSDRLFHLEPRLRTVLSRVITETENAFVTPIGKYYKGMLSANPEASECSEQLIKVYLTEFLLLLLRENAQNERVKAKIDENTFDRIVKFLEENIAENVSLSDVASFMHISQSTVKKFFKENTGKGFVTYFTEMKMKEAKRLFREYSKNVAEVAQKLGYNDSAYFARVFRRVTHLSPSEYKKSVKEFDKCFAYSKDL